MKDLFSKQASDYVKYRPTYPQSLYDYIFEHVQHFDAAWDCGTGNGQAAVALANRFKHVFATDLSANQLQYAIQRPNITYQVSTAEETPFPDHSFDLVTVAQALHWFDFDRFYPELQRVLKPEGIFAAWGYGWARISPEIDHILDYVLNELLADYWDPRRSLVDEKYETIPFPLKKIDTPAFEIKLEWTFQDFINYLSKTGSAVQTYVDSQGINPIDLIKHDLEVAWGTAPQRQITWPIFLLMGTSQLTNDEL